MSAQNDPIAADIRDVIFQGISEKRIRAVIWSRDNGIIAGSRRFTRKAEELGLVVNSLLCDGDEVRANETIALIEGMPKQISLAEDSLLGLIAKTSGIATAARKAVVLSGKEIKIVSGGWKKVSHQIKDDIREAVMIGGAGVRMTDEPFVYLDKNYVRMLGGISPALRSVARFNDRAKVVQIRGETGEISIEAILAVGCGADIVMVDTGNISDLQLVSEALRGEGLRGTVKIAFGGSIQIEDIPRFLDMDVDILDIGRAIIDAPMLDIRLDVEVAKQ
jgi:nicotinate-nucleotide pyrophosphorylase (carboxylating)